MKLLILIVAYLAIMLSKAAFATEMRQYSEMDFNAEIYAGSLVALVFLAEKCPACDQQTTSISQLKKIPQYKAMKLLSVNFDSEKSIVRKFNVEKPGTIILIKGTTEVYRSSVVQTPNALESAVDNALK